MAQKKLSIKNNVFDSAEKSFVKLEIVWVVSVNRGTPLLTDLVGFL